MGSQIDVFTQLFNKKWKEIMFLSNSCIKMSTKMEMNRISVTFLGKYQLFQYNNMDLGS